MYVFEDQRQQVANPCPKCKTGMAPFDGADLSGTFHRGLQCPKCSWFVGYRLDSHARGPPRGRPGAEKPFQGRIRTGRRGG